MTVRAFNVFLSALLLSGTAAGLGDEGTAGEVLASPGCCKQ